MNGVVFLHNEQENKEEEESVCSCIYHWLPFKNLLVIVRKRKKSDEWFCDPKCLTFIFLEKINTYFLCYKITLNKLEKF